MNEAFSPPNRNRRSQGRFLALGKGPPPPRRYSVGSVIFLNRRGNPSSKEGKTPSFHVRPLENSVGQQALKSRGCQNVAANAAQLIPSHFIRTDTAGNRIGETGRFPGVEAANQVRDVAEAGAPQQTRGDGAPITAFTVHHEKTRWRACSHRRGKRRIRRSLPP